MYELVIKGLKKELEDYAVFIEKMIKECIEGMLNKNAQLLNKIIKEYEPISDEKENNIETHCIEVIARYKPMAHDLREVLMIMKMSDDLERIGDHIENICESAVSLSDKIDIEEKRDIVRMSEIVQDMIKLSIQGFITENPVIARNVLEKDEIIDDLNKTLFKKLLNMMIKNTELIPPAVQFIRISHNFERIGDLATNLCEDIIYIEEGNMIRHKLGKMEV